MLGYLHHFLIECKKVFQETFWFLVLLVLCMLYCTCTSLHEHRKGFQPCLLGQLINLLCISQPRLMLLSCLKQSCILSIKSEPSVVILCSNAQYCIVFFKEEEYLPWCVIMQVFYLPLSNPLLAFLPVDQLIS